jgi:hypothetical protein
MTEQAAPTCQKLYAASATALKAYQLKVSKADYATHTDNNYANNIATISGNTVTYYTEDQINLRTEGATLTVRLIDRNGKEINNPELNSQTTVSGSNSVYVVDTVTGATYLQDTATGVPAQFYLGDNRTTFNVIVNFSYVDFTDSKTVAMTKNGIQLVTFRLNQSQTQMQCTDNLDCPTNFCDGNHFYKLEGCLAGTCSYKTPQSCSVGCDTIYGCYDAHTLIPCTTRFDCNNTCLTNWRSSTGVCGSDGYCINLYKTCNAECPYSNVGCNATTGLCCDSEGCYTEGRERYRFYLAYSYVGVDSLIPPSPNPSVSVMDYDFYCGIENAGERICVIGSTIPLKKTGIYRTSETFITSMPDNWKWSYDANGNYEFYDIAVECGTNCDLTYDYCPNGCNRETGYCQHAPVEGQNFTEQYEINIYQPISIVQDSINQTQLRQSGLAFLLLLATPIFIVTMISLIIGGIVGWKTKEPLLGTIGFIAVLTVFSLLQLFPIWLVLVLIVIAGLVFSKIIVNMIKGGG